IASAYKILKGKPKVRNLNSAMYWTEEEIQYIKQNYPFAAKSDIIKNIPNRKWAAISRKACDLGIKRHPDAGLVFSPDLDPLMKVLRAKRITLRLSEKQLVEKIIELNTTAEKRKAISSGFIISCELGFRQASLWQLRAWSKVLGFELHLSTR